MNSKDTDRVCLDNGEGSSAVVHMHGATVISWVCCGKEVLFCRYQAIDNVSPASQSLTHMYEMRAYGVFESEKAVFDNKKAIRGGIPLVFPQFGPWSNGPQHGFARIKRWQLESPPQKVADGSVAAKFSLVDDEDTRNMWDNRFKVQYCVQLHKDSLQLMLNVDNTGTNSFEFTTLMHTYFRVPDIANARLSGLQGCTYVDKVHGGEHKEERSSVSVDENYDRVYQNADAPVVLTPDGGQPSVSITVTKTNLPDVVVWNPWVEKARAMADFGDDEYKNMLCVEAGHVSAPVTLEAGKCATFTQRVVVSSNL